MSDFVMSARQAAELDHAFERAGFTPQDVKKLSSGNVLTDVLQYLRGTAEFKSITVSTVLDILTVDNRSLDELIAAGHYDWTNDSITPSKFSITGDVGGYEYKLFHFDRNISSEDAVREIEKTGWQIANIEHLLVFGEKNPEEQREYPIVALGSVATFVGNRGVPHLVRGVSKRGLDLRWWRGSWDSFCRFLAVRKVSGS